MNSIKPLEGSALWLAALVLALGNFVAVLNLTITNVTVPTIAGNLGVTTNQGTWIITSYAVAEAITVPLTGWLAARFGPVRVFVVCITLFAVFSILCGLSTSLGMIVFSRIMQGLAGGPMMPMSQTMLLRIFPREKTPAAMTLWSMTTLVAPIVGPVAGGTLCDIASWRWVFFINVPAAIFCAIAAMRLLKKFEPKLQKVPIDVVGLILLIVWVGSLQVMLDEGKNADWFSSVEIRILGIVALIGFICFIAWELTERHPIVDLKVFRHKGFLFCVLTMVMAYAAFMATGVLTPLWLQTFMGYTSTWSGVVSASGGVLAVITAPFAAALMHKVDGRKLVFIGVAWMALCTFVRGFAATNIDIFQITWPILLQGFGVPLFFVSLTAISLSSVRPEETASAAGLQSFLRTLGGAFATSMVTTEWDARINSSFAQAVGSVDANHAAANAMLSQGMNKIAVVRVLAGQLQAQSVMIATNQLFILLAILLFVSSLIIWFVPRPKFGGRPPQGGH